MTLKTRAKAYGTEGTIEMKNKFEAILLLTVILLASSVPSFAKEYSFAGQAIENSPATKFMHDLSREIAKKTNNRVVLKVYPANKLGGYNVVTQELMKGKVDFSCQPISTDYDPRLAIIHINGYVRDYAEARKVFAPGSWMTNKLTSFLGEAGIKMLGCYIAGFIGIASKQEVADFVHPKAATGIELRIPDLVSYKIGANAMGFRRTVVIPYFEVSHSMKSGACGAESGYPAYAAYANLSDVMKHWYHSMHAVEYFAILASEKTWKKIAPADQKIIKEICVKYTKQGLAETEKNDKKALELMKKHGINVHTFNRKDLKEIHDEHVASWSQFANYGVDKKLMDEFIAQFK